MQALPKKTNNKGQTLINLLVAIALFAILAQALFTLISASYSIVTYTRARVGAKNIAQKRIEEIRNLPYDQVGTEGGIPPGEIQPNEYEILNGLRYLVTTSIVYVDDEFDGVAPIDLLPTDYKRVRVNVSWEGLAKSDNNPVTMITDIAPSGVETTEGGGTLSILVFDANAQPVGQADVHIFATETEPPVNLTLQTGDNGRVILPGTPVCKKPCYQITVTKDGYSSERTYSTDEVDNPNKPHVSVLEGSLTEISFAIDKLSSLNVTSHASRELDFEPLPQVTFDIRGDKTIGTDSKDNPVYKYQETVKTDVDGQLTIDDLEWDNYFVTVGTDDGYDISGSNPFIPFEILPGSDNNLALSFSTHTGNNLLVSFSDAGGHQIASVSASLYDHSDLVSEEYSGAEGAPDFGQVFFADLNQQFYGLVATHSAYMDYSGQMDVYGNSAESVILQNK